MNEDDVFHACKQWKMAQTLLLDIGYCRAGNIPMIGYCNLIITIDGSFNEVYPQPT